jgi:hypothetical protein
VIRHDHEGEELILPQDAAGVQAIDQDALDQVTAEDMLSANCAGRDEADSSSVNVCGPGC